jgi:hypothetical protein
LHAVLGFICVRPLGEIGQCCKASASIAPFRRNVLDTALVNKGSNRALAALLPVRDMVPRQRRVGGEDGRGGSEDSSCKRQTYPPFAHVGQPGTRVA